MTPARILVAGVGNVFLGDDGFGCEVVRRLAACSLPEGVCVVDFGIRGFDLGFALLDGYDAVILVDAMSRGGSPGTLYVIEPCLNAPSPAATEEALSAHSPAPAQALQLATAMGCRVGILRVLGCEPATFGPEGEGCFGLSTAVVAVVGDAADLALSLVADIIRVRRHEPHRAAA